MFLISALLVSIVIALFVGAALKLSIGSLQANSGRERQAVFAAESGLRYVQTRFAADYNWDADGGLVVNEPDLIIREEKGNIIGLLRTPEDDFAQFRVRFNHQDDASVASDGRSDPPSSFIIDSQFVSVNNLLGGAALSVPRADGPNWSVTASSPKPYKVPGSAACVIVEGRYGPGLGNLSSSNMNPKIQGSVSTKYVEAYLETTGMEAANSAAMSAGDMLFDLKGSSTLTLSAKEENALSRVRSRSSIKLTGGGSPNLKAEDAEAFTKSGTVQAIDDGSLVTMVEDTSTDFYRLAWNDVRKASSTDSSIKAGTYVIWDDGSLHYYDKDYTAYASDIIGNPTDPGTVIDPGSLPAGLDFDSSTTKPTLTISQNLHVDSSSTTAKELNIIPRAGVQEDPPGAASAYTESQMVKSVLNSLGPPNSVSGKKATWTVPINGSVPGGKIRLRKKQAFGITSHEIYLQDAGPGRAKLVINDNLLSDYNPRVPDDPLGALNDAMTRKFDGKSKLMQMLDVLTDGMEMHEFNFTAISPTLRANDITVLFAPPEGKTAILSSDSTIRIGSNVKGDGGSITSGESIRIVGNGTDFSASLEDGLTMYAKKDIVMSSLKETSLKSNTWEYRDLKLKGVLYSWGNIEIKMNNHSPLVAGAGKLKIEGSVVAYGGDPSSLPGSGIGGDIRVWSEEAELTYNPAYLLRMDLTPPPGHLSQTLFNTF